MPDATQPHGVPVIAAVDGGNSKTDVVLVDADGHVVGEARGPGSNHQLAGIEGAMDAINETLVSALAASGLEQSLPIEVGVYCLAGVDFDIDVARLSAAIDERAWTTRSVIYNDTMAVSRAGMAKTWGIGIVCGTGINCAGLGPDGAVVRFPSLGELSGDFAPGGAWLGVRALGLALRAGDGRGMPTSLQSLVPAYFGLPDPEAVLQAVYSGERPYHDLFELAEVALGAAAAGDHPAREAADFLADEVVAMARAAIERLGVGGSAVEVVLGGGIFNTTDAQFLRRVTDGIRAVAPDAELVTLDARPVLGAALLGLDVLGAVPSAYERLRSRLAGPGEAGE